MGRVTIVEPDITEEEERNIQEIEHVLELIIEREYGALVRVKISRRNKTKTA